MYALKWASADAHFGTRLGTFFYWTRFFENNAEYTVYFNIWNLKPNYQFGDIPPQFIWSLCSRN